MNCDTVRPGNIVKVRRRGSGFYSALLVERVTARQFIAGGLRFWKENGVEKKGRILEVFEIERTNEPID